jgi:tetratricopeptide (TPR) repeat protein
MGGAGPRQRFTVSRVAELLGLKPAQVRRLARAAGLEPGPSFGFQDVVVLRALAGLVTERISPRRVVGALAGLRAQRPDLPLSSATLQAQGPDVLVRDERGLFEPLSGQRYLDFAPPAPAGRGPDVISLDERRKAQLPPPALPSPAADVWYERGVSLEEMAPDKARESYQRALSLDPSHADAHINLGRLDHEAGDLSAAEAHYRAALVARPSDATARFNLGVVLDDAGQVDAAIEAYQAALEADPAAADAHFNLARLFEHRGDKMAALRHLARYKTLTRR